MNIVSKVYFFLFIHSAPKGSGQPGSFDPTRPVRSGRILRILMTRDPHDPHDPIRGLEVIPSSYPG